jgi:hypothetical protein
VLFEYSLGSAPRLPNPELLSVPDHHAAVDALEQVKWQI